MTLVLLWIIIDEINDNIFTFAYIRVNIHISWDGHVSAEECGWVVKIEKIIFYNWFRSICMSLAVVQIHKQWIYIHKYYKYIYTYLSTILYATNHFKLLILFYIFWMWDHLLRSMTRTKTRQLKWQSLRLDFFFPSGFYMRYPWSTTENLNVLLFDVACQLSCKCFIFLSL